MFQLYKKRGFSELLSDTISFFKSHFKNYFGNFITITGGLLIVLCLIYFFLFKDLFGSMFGGVSNPDYLSSYLEQNLFSNILLFLIAFIVAIVFSCITLSFPVAYFQLMDETDDERITVSELFERMKTMLGRVFIFSLISMVTIFPLTIFIMVIFGLLSIIIIGIPLLIIGMLAFFVIISQALYVYLNEDAGYFEAIGRGWSILFSKKFWHYIGNTLIIYVAIYIIQMALAMIPYVWMLITMFSAGDSSVMMGKATAPMITLYMVSIVASYLFVNVMYVNQGLIYYSSLEQESDTQALSEIDSIGQNEE